MLHDGPHPGKSSIEFLPMIDLDPCDSTCIYSTLKFVVFQARLYDVTPVLIFDQPLYWKALTIIRSQPSDRTQSNSSLSLGIPYANEFLVKLRPRNDILMSSRTTRSCVCWKHGDSHEDW